MIVPMTDDKKWALAWAKFDAMYKNLPNMVTENHVGDFHQILGLLTEASGEDLESFQVPESRIGRRVTSFNMLSGSKTYSEERYCEKAYLLTQMDAVRGYFANLYPTPAKPPIGF